MQVKIANTYLNCRWLLVLWLLWLTGCTSSNNNQVSNPSADTGQVAQCSDGSTRISKNFATGQFHQCLVGDDGTFSIYIAPESEPINPSPWYAFEVSQAHQQNIQVILDFGSYHYRYWPKISSDGIHWKSMALDDVEVQSDGTRLLLNLAQPGKVYIAAQPVLSNQNYHDWLKQVENRFSQLRISSIGTSKSGRELSALEFSNPTAQHSVVILGRQHPPEVTGALALQTFIDTLLAEQPLAIRFREKFNLLVLPNLNPDGVDKGYWRLNENYVDLNRDWGPFEQPETRQANAAIEAFIGTSKMVSMLDFHSTKKNILYTQKDGQSQYPEFADNFHKAINDILIQGPAPELMARKGSHNPKLNTAKRYFYERYDIPAITVELNDYNTQFTATRIGRTIAIAYMQQMLDTVEF